MRRNGVHLIKGFRTITDSTCGVRGRRRFGIPAVHLGIAVGVIILAILVGPSSRCSSGLLGVLLSCEAYLLVASVQHAACHHGPFAGVAIDQGFGRHLLARPTTAAAGAFGGQIDKVN